MDLVDSMKILISEYLMFFYIFIIFSAIMYMRYKNNKKIYKIISENLMLVNYVFIISIFLIIKSIFDKNTFNDWKNFIYVNMFMLIIYLTFLLKRK